MRIDLSWIKEFVSINAKPQALADRLSLAGLEVEAIEPFDGTTVLTLGITPNRGDCLSLKGVAREISALHGKKFNPKTIQPPKGSKKKIGESLKVTLSDKKGCPRYMARMIRGVHVAPSPEWMQKRLENAGIRPINNVVDCTNYVMWELGHPLHAFDYRFLRGHQIVIRREKSAAKFETLDGVKRDCEPTDLFICDGEGPVALAGIMGGANSQIRNDTQDIVLEAAYFNPQQIHRTRKRLKLSTDSSYRFERGVDPNGVAEALHRVTALILQTAGGEASADWIDLYPSKIKPVTIPFSAWEVERVLGVAIAPKEIQKILSLLGFQVRANGKSFSVQVPTFRSDITIPVDLVEEVARIRGFDAIIPTLPKIQMNRPRQPATTCAAKITADTLLGLGFSESCHLSFTSVKKGSLFAEESKLVSLNNPLSEEHALLRPSLIPSLLDAVAFNLNRQRKNVKLFELKSVFTLEKGKVVESKRLGVVASGDEWDLQWALKPKKIDFFSIKGMLQALTKALHLSDLEFVAEGNGSALQFKGKSVGWCGLLDPQVAKVWGLEEEVFVLDLDWEVLAKASTQVTLRYHPLSKYPYIERDVALVVDVLLPAEKVLKTIHQHQSPWVKKVLLFDVFKGGNLPQNKKSLAYRFHYASPDRTLTNEEVNQAHAALISSLENELSAQLRK